MRSEARRIQITDADLHPFPRRRRKRARPILDMLFLAMVLLFMSCVLFLIFLFFINDWMNASELELDKPRPPAADFFDPPKK